METTVQSRYQFKLEIFFWFIFIAIWFSPLGCTALLHADEGRYATIALNMLNNNDWITPRLNGILYFEKPILPYWMGTLSFLLFGVNDFAARFWPALAGMLTVICLAYTAGKIWSYKERHLVAIISGGMTWIIANSHFLSVDMGLTLFLTLALCSFILSQHKQATSKERIYWMLSVWSAMALALLTKGLIGLLIPGATLVLYSLINKQWRFWKDLQWVLGPIVFALITLPWFILVSTRNPDFAHFFFIHEQFERFLTTEHRRTGPWHYFIPILLIGALPWTSWLPRLFINGIKDTAHKELRVQRLLLIWSLFIFIFFSKSGSKLPSYILPMFPAIALMLAWHINRVSATVIKKHLLLPLLCGIILIVAYPVIQLQQPEANSSNLYLKPLYQMLVVNGFVLIIATIIAWFCLKRSQKRLAMSSLAFASLIIFNLVAQSYNTYGTRFKSTRDIVPKIANHLTDKTKIYSVGYYDQTFPFYLRRNVILVDYVDEFEFGQKQQPELWIPTIDQFITLWNETPDAIAITNLLNYNILQDKELPMTILYQDERRIVIKKDVVLKSAITNRSHADITVKSGQ